MSRFDEETLVLYAAGRLDESRRRKIAEAASVVVLRSSGVPSADYPFEVLDGIVVRLNAWEGRAEVDAEPGLQNHQKGTWGEVKISSDTWHHIRITDGDHLKISPRG